MFYACPSLQVLKDGKKIIDLLWNEAESIEDKQQFEQIAKVKSGPNSNMKISIFFNAVSRRPSVVVVVFKKFIHRNFFLRMTTFDNNHIRLLWKTVVSDTKLFFFVADERTK